MIRLAPSLTASFFAASILILATQGGATAQTYPERSIRLLMPFPAGGTPDALGRMVATQVESQLGLLFLRIGAVTIKAVLRKDRQNAATEVHGSCDGRRG